MPHDELTENILSVEKSLRHIAGNIKQKGREILSNYTITPPQFIALQWLDELGDMTIGELSTKMYLAFSTTTDLVDRMEQKELVIRSRDTKDRRVVRVHLLEKGKQIITEVVEKRQGYLQDVVKDFDDSEVEVLSTLLLRMYQEMKEE
ncbi:MarR family transcriptional regulator [Kurthia sp. 3B1D]|uniref:MarR family transcriptional regulator n=2 Tax=Kurthia TaxID=1649 RepID=A0A433RY57_9BACL|nr:MULTISPECIES: MarR family transcriptional regulator [unclassified Kurthia]RUS58210.1 MarR family transcriptional regulator [Kurthia sp. 3B1D]HIX41854.1 MarR family transcriptional regulator [Candidatus Kurthia intestinigallinarum]